MRFSIVAPNFNEMPYLRDWFFASLKEQTFKDFEVIVVDGGSTDGSLDELQLATYDCDFKSFKVIVDKTRNIGYIRNLGCSYALGDYIVNTSTDICLDKSFLKRLDLRLEEHPTIEVLGARTFPHGSKLPFSTFLAYYLFDILRFWITTRLSPIKKIRPAGNLCCIKRVLFEEIGGYPEVQINEDGLLGSKLDEYWKKNKHKTCEYSFKFKVWHHVKRFEQKGGLKSIAFYFYVLGLIFPFLQRLLKPLELKSAREFSNRSDLE